MTSSRRLWSCDWLTPPAQLHYAEDVDDEEDVYDSCGIVCGLDEMIYFVDEDDDVHKSACYV